MPRKSQATPATTKRKNLIAEDVLERAAELFSQKGVGGTSFQDIADAMGLTRRRSTIIFRTRTRSSPPWCRTPWRQHRFRHERRRGAPELLGTVTRRHPAKVIHIINRRVRLRVIDRSEQELPKGLAERHDSAKRGVLSGYMKLIARGIKANEFRPVDERLAAFSIIGMSNWVAWWFKEDGPSSAAEVADFVADMAVRSLQRSTRIQNGNTLVGAIDQLREVASNLEALNRPVARTKAK